MASRLGGLSVGGFLDEEGGVRNTEEGCFGVEDSWSVSILLEEAESADAMLLAISLSSADIWLCLGEIAVF